ncbi:MAG TPA: hypothetical protein ENG48_03000 [Candidatus Atribacteria bacterium]|nr:hypothetical protein [Candidatus Atribacteria bacterium]
MTPSDVNCGIVLKDRVTCTTTVTFTISNISPADACSFKVLVQADPGLAQQGIVNIASLASGVTTSRTTTLPPGGNCFDPDCTVCITVDLGNEIKIRDNKKGKY